MGITDTFSKRQKQLRGEIADVFVYDNIPYELRVQIVHIVRDAIGFCEAIGISPDQAYKSAYNSLCREYGVFSLENEGCTFGALAVKKPPSSITKFSLENEGWTFSGYDTKVFGFLLDTTDTEKAIDVIELLFKYIDKTIKPNLAEYSRKYKIEIEPDDAIDELNQRFKEHGVGYQFEAGEIIRMDSTYVHSEITKPTIALLSNKKFAGPNEEYLKAHEHYRNGRNKECLIECLKALESTIKVICTEKGWKYDPKKDTAKDLIQICFQNALVPAFTQNQFTSLQNLLESGVPTIRNRLAGHGQGQVPQKVDDEITRYCLNLTGTNIIFLIEQSGLK